jgi:hypothetical protein
LSFTFTRIHPFIFVTTIRIHSVLCPLLPQEYSQYFFFTPRHLSFITTRILPILFIYTPKSVLYYHNNTPNICSLLPKEYTPFCVLYFHKNTPIYFRYCRKNTLRFVSFNSTRIRPFIFVTAIRIHSVLCSLLPQEYSQYFFFTHRYLFFITTRINPYLFFTAIRIHLVMCSFLPQEYTQFCAFYIHKLSTNLWPNVPQKCSPDWNKRWKLCQANGQGQIKSVTLK